jgi:hypothetical protein
MFPDAGVYDAGMALRFSIRRLLVAVTVAALAFAGLAFAVKFRDEAVRASTYSRFMKGYFTRDEARRHAGPIVDTWPDPPPP